MPDSTGGSFNSRWGEAVAEVERWLMQSADKIRPLKTQEFRRFKGIRVRSGWRVPVKSSRGEVAFELLLCDQFPWRLPKVALENAPEFLSMPHLEHNGVLCAAPNEVQGDPARPVSQVQYVLRQALRLYEGCAGGGCENDFREELLSYWTATPAAKRVRFISDPDGPSREIVFWAGELFYLAGESHEALGRWVSHFSRSGKPDPFTTRQGIFLALDQPLVPSEYPSRPTDLTDLVGRLGEAEERLLMKVAAKTANTKAAQFLVVLSARTQHGAALTAVTAWRPLKATWGAYRRGPSALEKGFRPGRMPPERAARLFLQSGTLKRHDVERADPAWIHGRGRDSRQALLFKKNVVVLGCGSVGAPIAVMLAQAGVGGITLVDPDALSWANVGRHPLGAQSIGKKKANELSAKLLADYPHMRFCEPRPKTWQEFHAEGPDTLQHADLIISAIGSWSSEGSLDEWHQLHKPAADVLYAWTEANACAGQAVLIAAADESLASGMSSFGEPGLQVTDWSGAPDIYQEPACGAIYQPYGPIELAQTIATSSELALDALLGAEQGSVVRFWAGRSALLESAGGKWTKAWEDVCSGEVGGVVRQMSWPPLQGGGA